MNNFFISILLLTEILISARV